MFSKKELFKLFWPVLIEQLLATTIGMVNTMMVSGVGIQAISAVSIVDTLNFVTMNLFISFSTGATVVVAQKIGAKDKECAEETASQSMVACVLTAILTGLLLIVFGRQIINLLFVKAEDAVKINAMTYLVFSGISYPFLAAFSMAAGILRASGNTKSPMRVSVVTNIINVGVGSVCIYLLKMGVAGAGTALLASRAASAGILLYILHYHDAAVGLKKISLKLNGVILFPVLRIGLPACVDGLIFNGGKLLIQTFVTELGTVSLAANSIASSVNSLINIPGNAIAIVVVTVIGQAVGMGVYGKELRKIMKSFIVYSIILLGILSALMAPVLPFFLDLYAPPPEVKRMALSVLHLTLIMIPLTWPTAFVLPACIRSTGDALFIMVASILSMWFTRVIGAWFTVKYTDWGIFGIWLFWCMDWVVRSISFGIRARTSRYINDPGRYTPKVAPEAASESQTEA